MFLPFTDKKFKKSSGYKLTEDAKRTLLAELKINTMEEKIADMVEVSQLTEKKLFFSESIGRQVNDLGSFLQPKNFKKVQERVKDKGFRNGFACLFYGSPGTGKTETVYQLARQTGRNIMVVDVPQIKSKWVGESEKNVKALFDRYREMTKTARQTPILLFNEADAIIGIRKNGAQNAVDKMENSLQNIILQEMESQVCHRAKFQALRVLLTMKQCVDGLARDSICVLNAGRFYDFDHLSAP